MDQASFRAWNLFGAETLPTGRCTVDPPLLKRSRARYVPSSDAVTSSETVTASPDFVSMRRNSAPPAARFCSSDAMPLREVDASTLRGGRVAIGGLRAADCCWPGLSFDYSVAADRCRSHGVCAIVRNREGNRVDFMRMNLKARRESLQNFYILQPLRHWIWVVPGRWDRGREHVDARGRQLEVTERSDSRLFLSRDLGAGPAQRSANYVPNQEAIHALIA